MTDLWFRSRTYGWGWTPVTVEGWLVVGAFVVGVAINTAIFMHRVRSEGAGKPATITFLVWLAILVGSLIAVCCVTGERPRWRWGN